MINLWDSDMPKDLLALEHLENDVSILIGENGSGKSTLLNKLSGFFLAHNENVVAIANSIHDKFNRGHKNFHILSDRSGRRQSRSTIKNALQNIDENSIQRLRNISRALDYVGFSPQIGFRVDRLSSNYIEQVANIQLNQNDKSEIIYLLENVFRQSQVEPIIWLEMESFSFSEIRQSSLTALFKWETTLKKEGVISRIEVFLKKNHKTISMLDASSGELSLITSIIYLSTVITPRTVILIDEPENSLHPKWQKEYARTLFDLFYLYQPKIIIATHSPLVINGAELFIENSKIYKAKGFTFEIQQKEPLNVEELIFRFFDLSTPQNRFLSDHILRYLNLLANEKITLESFENEIEKIENKSYDDKQMKLLESIKVLAAEMSSPNT